MVFSFFEVRIKDETSFMLLFILLMVAIHYCLNPSNRKAEEGRENQENVGNFTYYQNITLFLKPKLLKMPWVPLERYAKPLLDKIRMCADLLNYERHLRDCDAGSTMCHKPIAADPAADILRSTPLDVQCLRRSLVPIVFIIGGPGSGKGVQSDLIVRRFGLTHISLGELVRAEIQASTRLGRFLAPIVGAGNLVPKEIIMELLKQTMLTRFQGSKGFLIDGFPRDEEQAVAFEKQVARAHLVLFLTARDDTLIGRLTGRGRADDDAEVVANRLRVFHQHTDVLKCAFGSRCKVVSAEGAPLQVFDVVSGHICTMLLEWGFSSSSGACPSSYVPLVRLQRK